MKKTKKTPAKVTTIPLEQNFTEFPLFTMDKDKVGSIDPIIMTKMIHLSDGSLAQTTYQLSPTKGLGGLADMQAFRAIEGMMLSLLATQGYVPRTVVLGSINNLSKQIYGRDSKEAHDQLKDFFTRMLGYFITSEGALILKEVSKNGVSKTVKKVRIQEQITLYTSVYYKEKPMPDGTIPDQVYITLSEKYHQNLNNNYTKRLNYNVYSQLSGSSARMYEILSLNDKHIHGGKNVILNYKYITDCLQIAEHTTPSRAEAQLAGICKYLVQMKIIDRPPLYDKTRKQMIFECNQSCFTTAIEKKKNMKVLDTENIKEGIHAYIDDSDPDNLIPF